MPALERPIGNPSPHASSKEMKSGKEIEQTEKKELRQRLQKSLHVLFPTSAPEDVSTRFSAYLDQLPKGAANRETKRALMAWFADRKQEGFKQAGDGEVVRYIEDLASYEQANKQFQEEEKRFVEEQRIYEVRRAEYERAMEEWSRLMKVRDPGQEVPRHRAITYSATTDTIVRDTVPMPGDQPLEEASRQRPGFIDTRQTEKEWKQQYQKALDDLRRSSTDLDAASTTEGLLTRLGKGPKALYAYLALITALFLAMPRGEHTFAAGQSRPDESSLSHDRPRTPPQKPLSLDRDKQLTQAPLEQVGPHELHVRLGNGLGREELFVVGSHQVQEKVRFEVGTGYRRVEMRAGEREEVRHQVQEIVDQALRPYRAQGINPETVNTVVDQIEVTLRGSASMEGRQTGNEALAERRVAATRELVDQALLAQGIPVSMVTYRQEQSGVEGDMAETTRELMRMGVRLRPGEEWSSFVNQMASLERTDGADGVQRLFAFHGVRQFNEQAFNDMFERQFRAHRAVNMRVTVRHRRLVIHNPAPVGEPLPPEIRPDEKPLTTTFYNDIHNPRTPVDDPPGQTSGQLERRMRRVRTWKTEEYDPEVRPRPPQKPRPPVRPTPPVPPILPAIIFDDRLVKTKPARQGPDSRRRPNKQSGNGGWTHRTNVG